MFQNKNARHATSLDGKLAPQCGESCISEFMLHGMSRRAADALDGSFAARYVESCIYKLILHDKEQEI